MKRIVSTVVVLLLCTMSMNGQSYATFWKQVKEAERQELPRTQYDLLMKIASKAQKEHQPAQLLKAELQGARVMTELSPDSLEPAVRRMEERMTAERDEVLQTVYRVVLRTIYRSNSSLEREPLAVDLTPDLCQKLAKVKAADYEPLMVKGADSRCFGDDLLSVIGYELEQYKPLHDYYETVGNRRAALLTALELLRQQRPQGRVELRKSEYLQRVDSLIAVYGDLPECGEVAIERYRYMENYTDATVEERWQYINVALERWGSWKAMNSLRNAQREMTTPTFRVSGDQRVGIPDSPLVLNLSMLRNIRHLTLNLYSVKAQGNTALDASTQEGYRKLKPLLTTLPYGYSRMYVGKREYEIVEEDSLELPGLPEGVYLIEIESVPATKVVRQLYYVSNVRVLVQGLPQDRVRYVAVNATTGQPLAGCHIRLTAGDKSLRELTTDARGEVMAKMENRRSHQVYAYTDRDKFCPPFRGYPYFNYYDNMRQVECVQLFTDRAIYRPGQTVRAAAIAYAVARGFSQYVTADRSLTLTLRDANGKVVEEKTLKTDEYGACDADFHLPTGLLNGVFTLEAGSGSCSFRVEEYKRPTFEVTFPEVNQHYEDGDTVQVVATAKSYAGVPVQGARVHYSVVRRQAWWWASYNRYWETGRLGVSSGDEEIASGDAVTGSDGTFVVEMPMVLPPSTFPQFFNFVCTAEVTDQGGETHQAQLSLPLGNRKTAFSCDLPDKVLLEDAPRLVFHLRNAAGIDVSTALRYRLDGAAWTTASTQQPLALPKLQSGRHTLEAVCEGDTLERTFTVFSLNDTKPCVPTDDWFYQSATQFPSDGSPVTIQVGSSDSDVHIVYSIIAGDSIIESGAVDKSNELINRKLTYKSEYRNGLLLTFAWVKQGRVYHHECTIRRPLPDKRLTLSWETFRDRLLPGQQEEWRLRVDGPDGKPVSAQLMATLYDKSLDQLVPHQWSLSPYLSLSLPTTEWRFGTWPRLYLSGYKAVSTLPVVELDLTRLDHSLLPQQWGRLGDVRFSMQKGAPRVMMAKATAAAPEALEGSIGGLDIDNASAFDSADEAEMKSTMRLGGTAKESSTAAYGDASGEIVQVRQNLQETAFFYPRLMSDKDGRVTLRFTLPESVTTWRFLGLAHTKDLCYGQLDGEAVAQKDVMVQPNVPRFVREGDHATVSARIVNMSHQELKGSARLELVDPETEQVVVQSAQTVTLVADSTVSVTFSCQSTTAWPSLLVCRVTVSGPTFSDGEQHYLPVLPSRERVTVTIPFTQNGPGTKTVDLTRLFPDSQSSLSSLSSPKLTIEYTNNPAWLMIQALPAVGHPHDDCAVCQAASLYANALGKYIMDQIPSAKNVFNEWRREEGTETSLHSQLEKNQDLRDLVLNETPWVADADNETAQRRQLADFFDENLMQQRLSSAVAKLQALQRADGSWSWWPGMPGSTFMTMGVSEMLVRLAMMTGEHQPMVDAAFRYLGKEMVELVSEMKKAEKKGYRQTFPSHTALQWLYICKLDGRTLPSDVRQANDYLISLLRKDLKNQTIYEKAMASIILDSRQYIQSLKEFTVYKEEMGRYYDTPRAGYSWRDYRIPTQVAVIEAISRLTPDDDVTLSEMRRWLLQQKRTQAWDTPLNSVDAIYAFLTDHATVDSKLLAAASATTLKIDGTAVDVSAATAGVGYVKVARDYQGQKTFSAEKQSQGTSWGAVYAQFVQPSSQIKDQASGVSIKREILLSSQSTQSTQSSLMPLQVGSRVTIRLTVESERDLDFVQVQDRRAACLEPVRQLSGYDLRGGYYCSPRDNVTNYFFDRLSKGKHVIETEYYVDRPGQYETGTCSVQCAYAPEYRGTTHSQTLKVE